LTNKQTVFFLLLIASILCCTEIVDNGVPTIFSIADTDAFKEKEDVNFTLDDDFEMDLWAPGPLLTNAVAISIDNQGNAYVTETSRRKSSDLDIRQHRDWNIEDLALQSIEDTERFHKTKLASDLSEQNLWMEDFNEDGIHDYKDLEVQSEIVKKIYDSDGDGRADASHLFADGINSMVTGVAAGVLHHDGEVFVTAAPDVFKFRDEDGDGDADTKEILSTGFGIHIAFAGHDMSGLTMGPDGKVYWSIGDLGVNVTDDTGKNWMYPNQGAVMRCNPDGSEFEVFAHGLRNPQEIAFDAYGNLISVDNDGDHPGERERYVHILEGSDTGWRINWQYGKYNNPYEEYKVWMDEGLYLPYFDGQAAYITPALALAENGPAGLAYNPGTAMNEEYNNTFFASYFTGNSTRSRLQSFQLEHNGSTFKIINEKDVILGINPTGVCFGPDGALYVNDWKEGYSKKETGRVWKLDSKNKNSKRAQTAEILKLGADGLTKEQLSDLLNHDDIRVRQMAQFALVEHQDSKTLLHESREGETLFGRLNAIWGCGQLMRKNPDLSDDLIPLLSDENKYIKSQAAKVIGDASPANFKSIDAIINLISDESDYVKRHAIEALGKLNNDVAIPSLITQLEKFAENKDPHLRHTVAYALSKLMDESALETLKNHTSADVRIGAVIALRELQSALVASFVNDENQYVATEAARAINDDFSIPGAVEMLASSLANTPHQNEAFLRRAINANLRVANKESAERLAAYFLNGSNDIKLRLQALWTLGYWTKPPVLDRVDNRYRELEPGNANEAREVFSSIFATLDEESNPEIKSMIICVAGKLTYTKGEDKVYDLVRNQREDQTVRIAAMTTLGLLKSNKLTDVISFIIKDKNVELRKEAQKILSEADFSDENKVGIIKEILSTATPEEKQSAINSLGNMRSQQAVMMLAGLVKKLPEQEKEIQLDIINAAINQESQELNEALQVYQNTKVAEDKLAQYKESMYGGSAQNGRQILAFNEAAQCLRCHQVKGYGGEVGPPLDNIGSLLSREELLLSLVDPSSRIAPGYGNVYYTLNDGTEIAGIVANENETELSIKDAAGKMKTILKSSIVEQENLPSGMPAQDIILNRNEIRDLVEFLASLK
jgi:putative membrane-bound dehydrogenase-like protein